MLHRRTLWEEARGCPVPNPLQDTAEPTSKADKMFKKRQNHWTERGRGNKTNEKQWREHQDQTKGRRRSSIHWSLCRTHDGAVIS